MELKQLILQNPFPPVEIPERMTWTSSSLKLFRKCKRKWFWKYIMRLRPRHQDHNLMIGSAFHHCMGDWYRGRRMSMEKIADKHCKKMEQGMKSGAADYYDQEDLDKAHAQIESFRGMMRGYSILYGKDRDTWNIKPESIEAVFKVKYQDFDFMGKMDLIATKRKKPDNTLFEHKTTSKIHSSYLERLPLDTQIRSYSCGAIKALGIPITTVLYDVIQKCKLRRKSSETVTQFTDRVAQAYVDEPDRYFYRESITFDKQDLEAFEFELHQTHKEYEEVIKGGIPNPFINPYAHPLNPRAWTPNDSTCEEYFRTCEYHGLCTQGLDHEMSIDLEQGDNLHEELVPE